MKLEMDEYKWNANARHAAAVNLIWNVLQRDGHMSHRHSKQATILLSQLQSSAEILLLLKQFSSS